MPKRYAKYGFFLLSRDYLVVRATMMGNDCFTITTNIYIYIYIYIYVHISEWIMDHGSYDILIYNIQYTIIYSYAVNVNLMLICTELPEM